jgi:hypothetical protein
LKYILLVLISIIFLSYVYCNSYSSNIFLKSTLIYKDSIKSFQNDTLIIGKFYAIGTKQKRQYIGKIVDIDSVCYNIKTEEGLFKIIKTDIIIFEEREPFKVYDSFVPEDTSVSVKIILKDESEIKGYIIQQDSEKIIFRKTANDSILNIPRNIISEIIEPKTEIFNGKKYIADPNDARLFLAPTARPIRKNVLLISDVEVLFPMIGYGIENIGSIMGGVSFLPRAKEQLVYLNVKATPFKFKNGDIAAGLIYFNWTAHSSDRLLIGYAGATLGTPFASFSSGFGLGADINYIKTGFILLGGEVRISEGTKLLTENWIFTKSYFNSMSFLGIRAFGSNIAFDIAILKLWGEKSSEWQIEMFPYISLTLNYDLFK